MVGPNYKEPCLNAPAEWQSLSQGGAEISEEPPLEHWWEGFHDPLLHEYIALAMENNNDLLQACENVLQAKALRQIAASRLYPQLDLDLSASRVRRSDNGPLAQLGSSTMVQIPKLQNLFATLFDVSWELDLFGKTRRLTEAADAYIGWQIAHQNAVLLTVTTEVAKSYMEVRGNQKLKRLAEEKIALLEASLEIEKGRFDAGYVSAVQLTQVEGELASVRAELPPLQSKIYAGIYALSVLTGECPAAHMQKMQMEAPLPKEPQVVAIGVQSDLLRRRPDVRQKERALAAQTALIGVAVASFFPSFSLTADGGLQAIQIRDLLKGASKTWSLGGDIAMPLFKGGRLIGQLRAAEASTAAAAYAYQQTLLTALEEAETALSAYLSEKERSGYLEQNVAWNKSKTEIIEQQFRAGLVSKTTYLDAKRSLTTDEQLFTQSALTSLTHLITLYKTLGGSCSSTL